MRFLPAALPALLLAAGIPSLCVAETLDVMVYTPYEVQQSTVVHVRDDEGYNPKPLVSGPPSAVFTVVKNGEERNVPVWMRTIANPHNDMVRVEYAVEGDYPLNIPAAKYAPGYGPHGYLKPGTAAPEAGTLVEGWGLAVLLPGESFEVSIPDSNATIRATLRVPVVETVRVEGKGKSYRVERARPYDNRAGTVP